MPKQIKKEKVQPVKKTQKIKKDVKKQTSPNDFLIIKNLTNCPKNLFEINEYNLFEALIYPVTKDHFFTEIYNKKPLIIQGSKKERFEEIIKNQMFNLNLKKMLNNTSSENIHVWNQSKTGIKSVSTDNTDFALDKYLNSNCSLYFGASLDFRNLYMKHLNYQMGHNFGGYYPSTTISEMDQMGEIETFVSRKGNHTSWHTDFQENFTIQMKGSKTWYLKKSGLEAPMLGYTPHYKKTGNLEMQQKVHNAYNGVDMASQYKSGLDSDCFKITLNEGDILYHPAGVWHAVSCEEDSISINFSMKAMRMGEFIMQAIQGEMFKNLNQRQFLRFKDHEDLTQKLTQAFEQAEKACQKYKKDPCRLVPLGLMVPRVVHFDLDQPLETQCGTQDPKPLVLKSLYSLNDPHLFSLLKVSDLSQPPNDLVDGVKYILNCHFTNQDQNNIDFQSLSRVFIYTENEKKLDEILSQKKDLKIEAKLARKLMFLGVIV